LETWILTIFIAGFAFAYVLSPLLKARGTGRRGGSPTPSPDPFGVILQEEVELELAAGKLDQEEAQQLEQLQVPETAETDEIELEIRARRRNLKQR